MLMETLSTAQLDEERKTFTGPGRGCILCSNGSQACPVALYLPCNYAQGGVHCCDGRLRFSKNIGTGIFTRGVNHQSTGKKLNSALGFRANYIRGPIHSKKDCSLAGVYLSPESQFSRVDLAFDQSVGNFPLNSNDMNAPQRVLDLTTMNLLYTETLQDISILLAVLILGFWKNEDPISAVLGITPTTSSALNEVSSFVFPLLRESRFPRSAIIVAFEYLIRLTKLKNKIPHESPLLPQKFRKQQKYTPLYIIPIIVLILANKYMEDHRIKNSFWSALTFIQLGVINRAEFDALKALSFNLYVSEAGYTGMINKLFRVCRYLDGLNPGEFSNQSAIIASKLKRAVIALAH